MSEPAQPLVHRGKSLLDQLLRIAQTRLELLNNAREQWRAVCPAAQGEATTDGSADQEQQHDA